MTAIETTYSGGETKRGWVFCRVPTGVVPHGVSIPLTVEVE